MTRLVQAMGGFLLALAALRWHEAAAAAPDRIRGAEGAEAVLVIQRGDCPLRRAAMLRWLTDFEEGASRSADRLVTLAVLGDEPGAVEDRLTSLTRLGWADTRSAARAVLRSGVPGTPAVVLLGPDGSVLLTDTFAPDGHGPRILAAAATLRSVREPAAPHPSPTAEKR
jgi:hypothetical protein